LKVRKLLAGVRGQPPADIDSLEETVVALSLLARELGESLSELDINPLLARESGVMALDALVVAGQA
jgi:hypothetical protein